jgi:MFS family permease
MSLDMRPTRRRDSLSNLTGEQVRKSLKNSILDGSAYSVMQGLTSNYITPYALTMKASVRQIGLLTSVPSLIMAAVQFAAPTLSERLGSRKGFILPMVVAHALMWLPILLIPYLFQTRQVWWLIAFMTLSTAFDAAVKPAWGSMMADLVPTEIRGRFFGRRNRITGLIVAVFTYVSGGVLQLLTGNTSLAFTIIFAGAIASRLVSFYFLRQMVEPTGTETGQQQHDGLLNMVRGLFSTNIGMFIAFCALINFTATIASPFFSPYMLNGLGLSYINYTALNSAGIFATIGFMTWWGKRMDRAGSARMLKLSSLLIPFVPIGWTLSRNLGWLIGMEVFSGFAWAGFQLSSSVFIFDAAPARNRTRYIALYNALIFIGASLGSLTGGIVAPLLPPFMGSYFLSIFLVSGIARLGVALFFGPRVREVRRVPQIRAEELLFSDLRPGWLKRAYGYTHDHLRRRRTKLR